MTALFPRSGFARNVIMMSSATGAGQAIAILAAPILTRLYTPGDFGVLGIFAAILGIVSVVASLRYEQAIPLPRRPGLAANVLVLAISIVVATSLVSGAVIVVFARDIAAWTNIPAQFRILYLIPLGVLLAGTYQVLNNWAVRQRSFGRIAGTTLLQGGSSTATQLALGILTSGPSGLVAGQILGRSAWCSPIRPGRCDSCRNAAWYARPGAIVASRNFSRGLHC